MQPDRSSRLRRAVVYAALATLLGVCSLTLTRCTQVSDNLTGVDVYGNQNGGHPVSCKKQCERTFQLAMKQEQWTHKCNQHACHSDHACKAAENQRHKAAVAALQAQKKSCQKNCHKQGGGHGH